MTRDEAASHAANIRAIVLAAGAGTRFGGGKLEARIDGRPILQLVLDALAEAGIADPLVVVSPDTELASIEWRDAARFVNPEPERGLSSSLRLGWRHALAAVPTPEAVLVALGDQPLIDPAVVRSVAAAPLDPARPIVAPRYTGTGAHNPLRIEASADAVVDEATGDQGLGPVIQRHHELVRWIDVAGDNPDIDTAADLARVAELAWAGRVRRNREQVDRVREAPDGLDFYASVTSIFRENPDRAGDPVLDALGAHARPEDTWLDIGAGAGRYALPLAGMVERVIAIDPSASMLDGLRDGMTEHGIENVEVVEGRWPGVVAGNETLTRERAVDASLIAHVGYDIEAIGPFLDAMERATRRECVALLMRASPASIAEPFWPPIHGERRISLPALPAFVDLLRARGREPSVEMLEASRRDWADRDELESFLRRQMWVAPGSAKDRRLQELIDEWFVTNDDGTVGLSVAEPLEVGLVAWRPG